MIIKASWLFNPNEKPLKNPYIEVENGVIKRIKTEDDKNDISQNPGEKKDIIDLGNSVILPGLVNAHSNLDYAFLDNKIIEGGNYIRWLKKIIKKKNENAFYKKSSQNAYLRMMKGGVAAVGDVKTKGVGLEVLRKEKIKGVIFEEFIDPEANIGESEIDKRISKTRLLLEGTGFSVGITAHSVYAAREQSLIKLYKYAQKNNLFFKIHIAESFEEVTLVKYYTGPLTKITPFNPCFGRSLTPLGYLEKIGIIENTILVYAVNLDESDFKIIEKYKNNVILCPGSNKYLNVGSAPYHRLKSVGAKLSLATDSLASNTILDLRSESGLAVKEYGIKYGDCLEMITKNPAETLGYNGKIEIGKPADLACFRLMEEFNHKNDLLDKIFENSFCVLTMVNGDIIYKAAKL